MRITVFHEFVNNNKRGWWRAMERRFKRQRDESSVRCTAHDACCATNEKMKRVNVSKKNDIRVISVFFVDSSLSRCSWWNVVFSRCLADSRRSSINVFFFFLRAVVLSLSNTFSPCHPLLIHRIAVTTGDYSARIAGRSRNVHRSKLYVRGTRNEVETRLIVKFSKRIFSNTRPRAKKSPSHLFRRITGITCCQFSTPIHNRQLDE